MEAKRKRQPLSDCTNTFSSSSSFQKPFTNPSVTSAIKRLLNSINGETVINSNSKPGSTATASSENLNCEVAARIASTTAKSSRVSGASGEIEFAEPGSVYSRRKFANRRKSKGNALAVPLTGSLEASINTAGDKTKEDGDTVLSNSRNQGKKKKRDPQHDIPQDFIEKQKAYFAEIDAFELSEEEVESADQLE